MYQLGRLLHSEKTVRSTDQQKRWCLAGWERWQQWQGCPLAQSGCWTRTTTSRSWKAPCRDFHGPSELRRSSKGFPGFISSSGLAVIWCPLNSVYIQIAGVYSLSKATRRRPGRARSSYGSCWDGTEGGHCEHISCYFWFWDRFQCFLHKIRFRKPAQISLHSALGAQDMDTMGPHFTGALSICRKKLSLISFSGLSQISWYKVGTLTTWRGRQSESKITFRFLSSCWCIVFSYSSFPGGRYFKDENFTLKHDRWAGTKYTNPRKHFKDFLRVTPSRSPVHCKTPQASIFKTLGCFTNQLSN